MRCRSWPVGDVHESAARGLMIVQCGCGRRLCRCCLGLSEGVASVSVMGEVQLRAWRVCLDPTVAQRAALARNAGAARWAFNYALARKVAAHLAYSTARDAVLADVQDPSPEQTKAAAVIAREQAGRIPGSVENLGVWRVERGDAKAGVEGVSPWWREVSSYTISSAMRDADAAFKAWLDSRAGRRAGRAVGYPRFKKRGRARDSFRIHHDVKKPTIRVEDARHVLIPTIGQVRLHSNLRRLIRLQSRDEVRVQSVTVSRQGDRWFASILVAHPAAQVTPSRRQIAAGVVGVDLGVKTAATLSTGLMIANPRFGRRDAERLARAQQRLARTQRGSANRTKAAARVGRIQARLAERRASWIHKLTKQLAAGWAVVAIEDLNVAGMTRSARGTVEAPGRQVRQKAGLNREILNVGFGEFRRQLDYKAPWYGSRLVVVDRWLPSSRTCSGCGWIHPDLTLAVREFQCGGCGARIDRDLNAARNIAAAAAHSFDRPYEGADPLARPKPAPHPGRPRPDTCDMRGPEATYRVPTEPGSATAATGVDVGRPPPRRRPPRQSDLSAFPPTASPLAS